MIHRHPVVLTTMEEDFRKIGILPEEELHEEVEGEHLTEMDDARNPRDIPSPDPSTMAGNDDSQSSINTRARHSTATQPRPKIAPDEKNDHDDALQAGATQGGGKKGSYNKKPNYREEVDRDEVEEGYEQGPDSSHGYSQYRIIAKEPGMEPTDSKHSDRGKAPDKAQGNSPTPRIAGMKKESSALRRAHDLIGEVEALVRGARTDEEIDDLVQGFQLIGENASLLADRLTEIGESYEVSHVVDAMEDLARSSIDALEIAEAKACFSKDKKKAIAHGKWQAEGADEDDEDMVEGLKEVFGLMVSDLMEAIEQYDVVLEDIAEAYADEDGDSDPLAEMSATEKLQYMRQVRGR